MAAAAYGCSECLCIAIESHRPELLGELLARDVLYRDMYWSTRPRALQRSVKIEFEERFPVLHLISPQADLSNIWRADCGHVAHDAELCERLGLFFECGSGTLVSLPMIARWHSSEITGFNAEQMLRDSRKFDYTEPQFFYMFSYDPQHNDDEEYSFDIGYNRYFNFNPIPVSDDELIRDYKQTFSFSFETVLSKNIEIATRRHPLHAYAVYELTSSAADLCVVKGAVVSTSLGLLIPERPRGHFYKEIGTLATLFNVESEQLSAFYRNEDLSFLDAVRSQLECGADLNRLFLRTSATFYKTRAPRRSVGVKSVLSIVWQMPINCTDFCSRNLRIALGFNKLLQFLLRNGLSVFISSAFEEKVTYPIGVHYLDALFSRTRPAFLPFVRGVAAQLLSLGYGRRELRHAGFPILDSNLCDTRKAIEMHQTTNKQVADELQFLVTRFDAGPLTLRELSRIAIRRAVGGADFARRIRSLGPPRLPPALLNYLSDPTELMLSDAELKHLIDGPPNPCAIQ